MWGIIATWCMAKDGVMLASEKLSNGVNAREAICDAIVDVEDNPYYKSVGYGGLPNEEMVVELDAAYMDGSTLAFGAVGAMKDYKNPIRVACRLSEYQFNNFLVGEGAEKYAHKHGFERKNMLSDRAKTHYLNRIDAMEKQEMKAYNGHDTVGMICLDQASGMSAATSTSGLFMKKSGRIGDSPVIGSGLYVDSEVGGASATGVGEDLMKGCISFMIVEYMRFGFTPQEACEKAVFDLERKLLQIRGYCGDLSVVAMDKTGNWGVASTMEEFSFVVSTKTHPTMIYTTTRVGNKTIYEQASKEWVAAYQHKRKQPVERISHEV